LEKYRKSIRKIADLKIDVWAQGHMLILGDNIKPSLASMKQFIENGILQFIGGRLIQG